MGAAAAEPAGDVWERAVCRPDNKSAAPSARRRRASIRIVNLGTATPIFHSASRAGWKTGVTKARRSQDPMREQSEETRFMNQGQSLRREPSPASLVVLPSFTRRPQRTVAATGD